ncbi:MAG: hypothetical protein ABS944_14765 [Solibacillus sp.]|uniref:hypothetical protein n=1 Tax=Solibacillus sp. TaxID=1909654 RepID=UPI0033164670
MQYLIERNKMLLLLVVGLILTIGILFFFFSIGRWYYFASFSGLFIIFALICYPLAIVYGRGQMIDIFHSIRMGDRQPFRVKKINSPWKPLFALFNWIIALFTLIFLGWIYGTHMAYQKLQMIKSFH